MDRALTRAELEHIFRTILQVVDNAYYRAEPFTVQHEMFREMKRVLEIGISALQNLPSSERAVEESIATHAND